ncbi:fimbrial biogenesis chaperone [Paraburkholderia terrae]
MGNVIRKLMAAAVITAGVFVTHAQASIVITGTRVIFPGQAREATIKLTNEGEQPALVQAWLDQGDANESPETIDVPFTLTPAMFRLDPKNGQTLRLIYTKQPLAQDKETLYWLNVLEVPPKVQVNDDVNRLQLAYRTRIKVIFRPQGLPGNAGEAAALTRWEIARDGDRKGYVLKATNPTPYFLNLGSVALRVADKEFDAGAGYVKPGESELFPVNALTTDVGVGAEVEYTSVNDWGGGVRGKQPVVAGTAR